MKTSSSVWYSLNFLCVALVATMLLLPLMANSVSARFFSSSSDSDGARVAKFDVAVQGDTTNMQLSIDSSAGESTAAWSFSVTNNSEVAVSYRVKVVLPSALPSGVSMQVDGKDPLQSPAADATEFVYVFAGQDRLDALEATAQQHVLTFLVDENTLEADVSLSGIQVIVDVTQLD